MKNSLIWMSSFLLFGALITFTSCDDDDDPVDMDPQNIVEFAANSDDYTILAEAVEAAGLDGALSGDGPFTVFAPDNAAFQALLDSNDDWNALGDIPTETLSAVLTNHVLAGDAVMSADLQDAYYTTLSETAYDGALTSLYVNLDDGVTLNGGPTVVAPDVEVSNGVIHGVDAVIGLPNVVTFATSNPVLSSLVAALTRSDLNTDFVAALNGDGPFTVFAPTNAAFQALLDTNDDWNELADIPVETLEAVLSYHVTSVGNVQSSDLMDGMDVPTLGGESLTVDLSGSDVVIDGANSSATVVLPNIQGSNGVVHVIDTVLIP
ncbi:MAG: fasciclin domain-containing protein [Bacteroidetes bacterium]|jgi:uncharacterized surface protein with fasciclin (FAS1) repeats|nr:fasciclin domain-containing protein [Bacteroidota bacterium]